MNESSKTVAFLITGCLFAVAAGSSWWLTQAKPIGGYEKVGEEFFPEFDDGQVAQSVEVSAFDSETEVVKTFSVANVDGLWRIPSHHNYPAEAADRLARTATSMIGVVRESCVNRRTSEHAEFGVLDPEDPEATEETAGKRITLRDGDGEVLADYIIGKPAGSVVEDDNKMVRDEVAEPDYFYVRVPDEKETYKARVKIDLSTRFSDWINPDLLKVEADDISLLELDDYELKEQRVSSAAGVQVQYGKTTNDRLRLSRNGFTPWQMEGLNKATEELVTLPIEAMLTMLDQMKIAGVRPKLTIDGERLVNSDLSINEELAKKNPQAFRVNLMRLQSQLEQKGFTIGATPEAPDQIGLLASRGELRAATKTGVKYTLYFGRAVTGSETEIEIGAIAASADDEESEGDEKENEQANESSGLLSEEGQEDDASGKNRSRYVAIRVDFDAAALGEAPVVPTEPTAPTKPDGYDDWKVKRDAELKKLAEAAADNSGDEKKPDEEKKPEEEENKQEDENEAPDAPSDIDAANEEEFESYAVAEYLYEQAQIQYATNVELYETKKIEYDAREKQGRQLVAELNERFADWYYVVPASSLKKLKLKRTDLVRVNETPPPPLESNTMRNLNRLPNAPSIEFEMKGDQSGQPNADSPADKTDSGEPAGDESSDATQEKPASDDKKGDGDKKEDGDKKGDQSSKESDEKSGDG